jgi:hypothetical protein
MPLPMIFKGTLSAHEASCFLKYEFVYRFPFSLRLRVAVLATGMGLVLGLYSYAKGIHATYIYVAIALCAMTPFAFVGVLRIAASLRYRLLASHIPESEVVFDTDTIEIIQNEFTIRYPWNHLKVIAHTPHGLMFFLKQATRPIIALPNRAFETMDAKYELLAHAATRAISVAEMA